MKLYSLICLLLSLTITQSYASASQNAQTTGASEPQQLAASDPETRDDFFVVNDTKKTCIIVGSNWAGDIYNGIDPEKAPRRGENYAHTLRPSFGMSIRLQDGKNSTISLAGHIDPTDLPKEYYSPTGFVSLCIPENALKNIKGKVIPVKNLEAIMSVAVKRGRVGRYDNYRFIENEQGISLQQPEK